MLKYIDDRWFDHLNSTVSFFVLDRIPSNKLLDINLSAQIPNYVSDLKI
jgi:hypothetical protein